MKKIEKKQGKVMEGNWTIAQPKNATDLCD